MANRQPYQLDTKDSPLLTDYIIVQDKDGLEEPKKIAMTQAKTLLGVSDGTGTPTSTTTSVTKILFYKGTGTENGLIITGLINADVLTLLRPGALEPTDTAPTDEQHFKYTKATGTIQIANTTPIIAGEVIPIFYTIQQTL